MSGEGLSREGIALLEHEAARRASKPTGTNVSPRAGDSDLNGTLRCAAVLRLFTGAVRHASLGAEEVGPLLKIPQADAQHALDALKARGELVLIGDQYRLPSSVAHDLGPTKEEYSGMGRSLASLPAKKARAAARPADATVVHTPPHARARVEIEKRLSEPPAPRPPGDQSYTPLPPQELPPAPFSVRRVGPATMAACVVCSASLLGTRAKKACSPCKSEYYRRKSLETYYLRLGNTAAAELAMRGERPTEVRQPETADPPDGVIPARVPDRSSTNGQFDEKSKSPITERHSANGQSAEVRNSAHQPIGDFAFVVEVKGIPVRCRTLDDLVAVVERFGGAA
ncbi:MAG TPA: hypothetical protein VK509_10975 [Polyangiales bacterium]|nr:hypothetical protein [Polyangiales bacterium]